VRAYGTAPRLFSKTGSKAGLGNGMNTGDNFPQGRANSSSVKNSDLVETIGILGASLESILQGCGPEAVDFLRFPLPL
jgi:hypothetical protein